MRWGVIGLGILSILGGVALGAYGMIGFTITASTGTVGDRTFFYVIGGGSVLAMVVGFGLILMGANTKPGR
jgi:hypothetical protein